MIFIEQAWEAAYRCAKVKPKIRSVRPEVWLENPDMCSVWSGLIWVDLVCLGDLGFLGDMCDLGDLSGMGGVAGLFDLIDLFNLGDLVDIGGLGDLVDIIN